MPQWRKAGIRGVMPEFEVRLGAAAEAAAAAPLRAESAARDMLPTSLTCTTMWRKLMRISRVTFACNLSWRLWTSLADTRSADRALTTTSACNKSAPSTESLSLYSSASSPASFCESEYPCKITIRLRSKPSLHVTAKFSGKSGTAACVYDLCNRSAWRIDNIYWNYGCGWRIVPCVNSAMNKFALDSSAQLRCGQVRDWNIIYKPVETKNVQRRH